MGVPRSRTKVFTTPKGTGVRRGVWIGGGDHNCHVSSVDDHTGPGDNDPFSLERWYFEGGRLNRNNGSSLAQFYDYQADITDYPASFPHLPISGNKSDEEYATRAIARSNPSAAIVDLPVALYELGDIFRLVRDSGRSLLQRGAGANIKHEFGIRPLASDMAKLSQFQDHVNRRVRVIQTLQLRGGYRRTMQMDAHSVAGTSSKTFQSNLVTVQNLCYVETRQLVKAHTRWKPTVEMGNFITPDAVRALARRAVLGLTVDASTLWEACPWSWLIDWGTNLGTYFKAHRNVIPANLESCRIMRHTQTRYYSYLWGPSNGLTMSPFYFQRDTKTRVPAFATPLAHLPFLNGRQVGILASLAVLRGLGGFR